MSDLRPTNGRFLRGLKAAVRRTIEMAGGVSSFEHVTRVKAPVLSKYGSPDDEKYIPVDVLMDLLLDTRNHAVLSYMAAELGFKLVPLDVEPKGADLPGMEEVAGVFRNSSELIDAIILAVSDGKIGAAENRDLNKKLDRLVQYARGLQRQINNATDGGAA